MRSAIITSSIFLQLAFPITAISYHPNTLQYDDRYQQSFYVPLPRKRRESVDPDDPENWHIPDDYEKEVVSFPTVPKHLNKQTILERSDLLSNECFNWPECVERSLCGLGSTAYKAWGRRQ